MLLDEEGSTGPKPTKANMLEVLWELGWGFGLLGFQDLGLWVSEFSVWEFGAEGFWSLGFGDLEFELLAQGFEALVSSPWGLVYWGSGF